MFFICGDCRQVRDEDLMRVDIFPGKGVFSGRDFVLTLCAYCHQLRTAQTPDARVEKTNGQADESTADEADKLVDERER